jgi:hypothetical protein
VLIRRYWRPANRTKDGLVRGGYSIAGTGNAPTVADGIRELDRCELEAKRLYPAAPTKDVQNWPEWAANLQKRAENVETCMRAAGYSLTAECSAPLKTYEGCMKIADEVDR